MPSLYPDIVSHSHLSSLGSFKRGRVSHVGFLGGTVVKNLPAHAGDAGDVGSISGLGRSPRVGNWNLFQYSYLENSMDRGVWWATQPMGSHRVRHDWAHSHLSYIHSFPCLARGRCLIGVFSCVGVFSQVILGWGGHVDSLVFSVLHRRLDFRLPVGCWSSSLSSRDAEIWGRGIRKRFISFCPVLKFT